MHTHVCVHACPEQAGEPQRTVEPTQVSPGVSLASKGRRQTARSMAPAGQGGAATVAAHMAPHKPALDSAANGASPCRCANAFPVSDPFPRKQRAADQLNTLNLKSHCLLTAPVMSTCCWSACKVCSGLKAHRCCQRSTTGVAGMPPSCEAMRPHMASCFQCSIAGLQQPQGLMLSVRSA
eukprot:1157790-Pelagomonas_calceolata.AAC.15